MKPDRQRIAIAEACGIKVIRGAPRAGGKRTYGRHVFQLPDYLHDFNAIYEAEGKLNYDQQYECGEHLRKIVLPDCIGKRGGHSVPNGFGLFEVAHATAAQRAEAFLKTIGKWIE